MFWWIVPANWRNQAWKLDMTRTNGDSRCGPFFHRKCSPLQFPKIFILYHHNMCLARHDYQQQNTKYQACWLLTVDAHGQLYAWALPAKVIINKCLSRLLYRVSERRTAWPLLALPPFLLKKFTLKKVGVTGRFFAPLRNHRIVIKLIWYKINLTRSKWGYMTAWSHIQTNTKKLYLINSLWHDKWQINQQIIYPEIYLTKGWE
jgi:hypothetical protein